MYEWKKDCYLCLRTDPTHWHNTDFGYSSCAYKAENRISFSCWQTYECGCRCVRCVRPPSPWRWDRRSSSNTCSSTSGTLYAANGITFLRADRRSSSNTCCSTSGTFYAANGMTFALADRRSLRNMCCSTSGTFYPANGITFSLADRRSLSNTCCSTSGTVYAALDQWNHICFSRQEEFGQHVLQHFRYILRGNGTMGSQSNLV
jgi:hypothetical protein